MKLDRSAFLVLVGTIAAAGCSTTNNNGTDGAGGSSGSGTGGGGGGGGSSGSGSGSGGKGGGAGSASGGKAGSGTDGGKADSATDGGGTTRDSATDAGADANNGADANGGGDGATSCDDSAGTPGSCTPIGSSACWSWGSSLCNSSATLMKPKVGAAAVACMLALPDTTCTGDDPYTCVNAALGAACPDSAADAACTKYIADCASAASMTAEQCHKMLDGFTAEGRLALATTMGSDCYTGFGLWSAIESL